MAWSKKRKPDLLDDLGLLLGDLCVQWGFCNRLLPDDLVCAGKTLTAVDFARAVLSAEGMNPDYEIRWLRAIRDSFVWRYGTSVSMERYRP
jgi:hypothetical protein